MAANRSLLVCMIAAFNVSFAANAATPDPKRPSALELTQVPGSQVFLAVPPGFTAAKYFSGFIHKESGAILYVVNSVYSIGTNEEGFAYEEKVEAHDLPFRKWRRTIAVIPTNPFSAGIDVLAFAPEPVDASLVESLKVAVGFARNDISSQFTPLEPGFGLRRSPGLRKVKFSNPSTETWHTLHYNVSGKPIGGVRVAFTATFEPVCSLPRTEGSGRFIDKKGKFRLPTKEEQVFFHFYWKADLNHSASKPIQPLNRVTAGKLEGLETLVDEDVRECYAAVFQEGLGCYILKGVFPPAQRSLYLAQFKAAARSIVRFGPGSSLVPTKLDTKESPPTPSP